MRIFKRVPEFSPVFESPIVSVWIRMEGIPLYMFNEMSLWQISNAIGKPLRINPRNMNRSMLNSARACVEIDLSKPLIDFFWVCFGEEANGVVKEYFCVSVFYDCLPPYCSGCSNVGHRLEHCKRKNPNSINVSVNQSQVQGIKATPIWNMVKPKSVVTSEKGKELVLIDDSVLSRNIEEDVYSSNDGAISYALEKDGSEESERTRTNALDYTIVEQTQQSDGKATNLVHTTTMQQGVVETPEVPNQEGKPVIDGLQNGAHLEQALQIVAKISNSANKASTLGLTDNQTHQTKVLQPVGRIRDQGIIVSQTKAKESKVSNCFSPLVEELVDEPSQAGVGKVTVMHDEQEKLTQTGQIFGPCAQVIAQVELAAMTSLALSFEQDTTPLKEDVAVIKKNGDHSPQAAKQVNED